MNATSLSPEELYTWKTWSLGVAVAGHTLPVLFWFCFYTVIDCYPEYFGKYKLQKSRPYSPNVLARWLILSGILGTEKTRQATAKSLKDSRETPRFKADTTVFFKTVLQNSMQHFLVIPAFWWFLAFDTAVDLVGIDGLFAYDAFPSWSTLAVHFTIFILIDEVMFYWLHRLLHVGPLYRWIHKQHHEQHTPFALGGEYAHPIESFLSNILPFLTGPILCKAHFLEIIIWLVFRLTKAAEAHSGYEIPYVSFLSFPGSMSAKMHDYHHSHNKGTYGNYFSFLDTLCGTDVDYRNFLAKEEKLLLEKEVRASNKNQK